MRKTSIYRFLSFRQKRVKAIISSEFHGDVKPETVIAIDDIIESEVERRYGSRMQRIDRMFKAFIVLALMGIAAVVAKHLSVTIVCSN